MCRRTAAISFTNFAKRKGITSREANELVVRRDTNYLGSVMVKSGDVDAMLTGLTHHYPSALRPPLQVVGSAADTDTVAGVYMLTSRSRIGSFSVPTRR